MKLPEIKNTKKYVGLYIIDFGDHCGVGFTAREVAELLQSEKFKDIKVYKIYNALPDGKMELKGVRNETFELEIGMFFYSGDLDTAKGDFDRLITLAVQNAPPSRAKVHLAKYDDSRYVTAVIYPAEYNDEISSWLTDGEYRTAGTAEGGLDALQRYYDSKLEILEHHQLFGESTFADRSGEELLKNIKIAVQR